MFDAQVLSSAAPYEQIARNPAQEQWAETLRKKQLLETDTQGQPIEQYRVSASLHKGKTTLAPLEDVSESLNQCEPGVSHSRAHAFCRSCSRFRSKDSPVDAVTTVCTVSLDPMAEGPTCKTTKVNTCGGPKAAHSGA